MPFQTFRTDMLSRRLMAGTFIKTPAYETIEVLARSGLDFVALDAEHAPFDRARLDACLAVARALDFPVLVRVPAATPDAILSVLDSGAVGVVVPHVARADQASDIARWSRFGHGGRGYAGSTRWAGFATRPMADILEQSTQETTVIVQIEEPEGVEAASDIAAVDGIDGLFVGPADLAVCLGTVDQNAESVRTAISSVGQAAKAHDKACMTFIPEASRAAELTAMGLTVFFIASEHGFMLDSAKSAAQTLHAFDSEK